MFSAATLSLLFTLTPPGEFLFGYTNDIGIAVDGTLPGWSSLPVIVFITTIVWLVVTYLTKPEKKEILYSFYKNNQTWRPRMKKSG